MTLNMDKIFKLTPLEYAQMKGLSTSGIRKRRLAGKEEGNFKIENKRLVIMDNSDLYEKKASRAITRLSVLGCPVDAINMEESLELIDKRVRQGTKPGLSRFSG